MKKVLIPLLIIVCFLIVGGIFMTKKEEKMPLPNAGLATATLSWEGGSFIVEIADTSETREQGLSGRKELLKGRGMFFVFPTDNFYSFWMKDMNFPIDILWLNSDFRVVHVLPAVAPETYPSSFTPPTLSRYVLEIPAGESAASGVVVGTQFDPPSL